ncbi:MAG: universal stress protein, partial [Candidatus Melainabacteria bacterium]|nr:universal stress protein [Candidatus Melainabacteria bacterium]
YLSSLAYLLSLSLLKEYATLFNYSKHNIWQKLKLTAITVVRDSAERSNAELLVEDGRKFLREEWAENVFTITEGSTEAILAEARKNDNSLLVIGAYGYKDPEENVLGRTTTKVIRSTSSSVLIFRPSDLKRKPAVANSSLMQSAI